MIEAAFEDADAVEVVDADAFTKLAVAFEATLDFFGLPPQRIRVRRTSGLPVGKGMASSTADIVAAARATADAFGCQISGDELATLAGEIEPSDGSMYPRIAMLRRRGPALRVWDWTPVFTAVVLVPDECVATATVAVERLGAASVQYDALVDQLDLAASAHNRQAFLDAAAASARLHHEIIGNRWTPYLDCVASRVGALGWNVAHTGTIGALLFEPNAAGGRAARAAAGWLEEHFDVQTMIASAG